MKVGQYPSLADLSTAELRKYRSVLDEEDHRELTKAVGLASHGVGVGAIVYLRRIFERLLEQAHETAKKQESWTEEVEQAYSARRVAEKIESLEAYLPASLVKTKSLYAVLSKGIHELSEDECNAYFPVVRAGIEMILEDKLAEQARQEKAKEAERAVEDLQRKLKEGPGPNS